jgi:hypothetical protein
LAGDNAAAQIDATDHLHDELLTKFRELPSPPLMQGIGDASLKITTTSEQAQSYFDQGLNQREMEAPNRRKLLMKAITSGVRTLQSIGTLTT